MWMAGFRYIVASTNTVQTIMRENNKKLDQKMREKTRKLHERKARQTKLAKKRCASVEYETPIYEEH